MIPTTKLILANVISFIPVGFGSLVSLKFISEFINKKTQKITLLFLLAFFTPLVSSEILKQICFKRFEGSERPIGACGCDMLCLGADVSGAPGCPSGHMASTTGVCLLFILFLIKSPNLTKIYSLPKRISLICINIIIIVLMGWARYHKKCHNMIQIFGGIILGSIISPLIYSLNNKIKLI